MKYEGRPRSSYVCTLYKELSHALSWTILARFCKMITLLQPVQRKKNLKLEEGSDLPRVTELVNAQIF